MSDVSQVERQLHLLALLSENTRGLTLDEILKTLRKVGIDVSRRTIERDIDYITQNFFIYEEERDGKTVFIAKKYNIKNMMFSFTELLSLYFAREVLSSYNGLDVGLAAAKILERMVSSMPKVDRYYIGTLKDLLRVNVNGIISHDFVDQEHLRVLKEAIEERLCVEIEYYSFNNNEMTNRVLEPYFLEISEGCWHLIGRCRLRNADRDLRVSRIKSITPTNEKFIRPRNFYERYKRNKFDKLAGEEKELIRLRFVGKGARFIREYEYDKADVLSNDGDALIFERTTAITPEIIRWILSYGAEVEVLEPDGLRVEVADCVMKMAAVYQIGVG